MIKSEKLNRIELIPIIISRCVICIIKKLSVALCVIQLVSIKETFNVIMRVILTTVLLSPSLTLVSHFKIKVLKTSIYLLTKSSLIKLSDCAPESNSDAFII